MAYQIDTTLIDRLQVLVDEEKRINKFRRRVRIKGRITAKGITKKGNIALTIAKDEYDYHFTVLKSHKERFALAQKLGIGRSVSAEGIPKLRLVICTRLKALEKGLPAGVQEGLNKYT